MRIVNSTLIFENETIERLNAIQEIPIKEVVINSDVSFHVLNKGKSSTKNNAL